MVNKISLPLFGGPGRGHMQRAARGLRAALLASALGVGGNVAPPPVQAQEASAEMAMLVAV
jgi:hypothetical protein